MLRQTGFAVFGYREYRLFWIAAAFSNIGMWTLVYGRLWLMRTLSDSEILLGSVTAATMAPVMIFSVWGGVVADTVNRLRLLRFTRLLFAVAGFVTAVLIATDTIEAWHLLAISAVTGVMLAFDIPTRGAMVASLVPREQLPSAIALYSVVFGGAAILGPSLFHPLVSAVGMEGLFFIVSASYVLTVLTLMRMDHTPHQARPDVASNTDGSPRLVVKVRARVRDMVDGVKYVRRETAIAVLIVYGVVIGIVATPLETLLPVITQEVYQGDTETYGRLLLAVGIGGLVATFTITFIGSRAKPPVYLAIGGAAVGVCYLMFGVVDVFMFAVAIAGVVGGLTVVKGTMSTTVVQTLVSDEFRGRVMSLMNFTWGAQAAGALFMGALAQVWGAPFAFGVAGVLGVVATIGVWLVALRKL